jgi:hypothetical protein
MKRIFLLLPFFFIANVEAVRFLANSDPQIGAQDQVYKLEQCKQMLVRANKTGNVEAVLWAGDLTNDGTQDQFDTCLEACEAPFLKNNISVFLGHGNHDMVGQSCSKIPPPLKYIKKTYGDVHYRIDFHGLNILCCGLYPEEKCSNTCWNPMTKTWLTKQLIKIGTTAPIVIFFHYNLVGAFSDWWSDKEKDDFYAVIQDYNVQLIITGHLHFTYTYVWKGIKTACVGGYYFAECDWDSSKEPNDESALTINFYDADGNQRSWSDLLMNKGQMRSLTECIQGTQAVDVATLAGKQLVNIHNSINKLIKWNP